MEEVGGPWWVGLGVVADPVWVGEGGGGVAYKWRDQGAAARHPAGQAWAAVQRPT